jgi:hypothetical protein
MRARPPCGIEAHRGAEPDLDELRGLQDRESHPALSHCIFDSSLCALQCIVDIARGERDEHEALHAVFPGGVDERQLSLLVDRRDGISGLPRAR